MRLGVLGLQGVLNVQTDVCMSEYVRSSYMYCCSPYAGRV